MPRVMKDRQYASIGVFLFLLVIALGPFVVTGVVRYTKWLRIEQNLTGKLKQAANANSIPLAAKKLTESIEWLESNNMTSGSSHVFIRTPACDFEFFYENLKSAKEDLENFPPPSSSANAEARAKYDLAESNQLMKLRETLLDDSSEGTVVTCPPNVDTYPSQTLWFFIWPALLLWAVIVCIFGMINWDWGGY